MERDEVRGTVLAFAQVARRERGPILFIRVGERFAESGGQRFLALAERIGLPLVQRVRVGPAFVEDVAFGDFQAVATERRAPQGRIDIVGVVVFTVAGEAEERGDHKLWSAAGARTRDRIVEYFEAGMKIGSVHGVAFHAVSDGFIDEIRAYELPIVRRGIGVLIIRNHHDQRQSLDRGEVHAFVKGSSGRAAFTNAGRTDRSVQTAETPREESPGDGRDHRTEMTDHRQQPFPRPSAMHIAVPTTHWSES